MRIPLCMSIPYVWPRISSLIWSMSSHYISIHKCLLQKRLLHHDKRPYYAIHLKKRPTADTFRKDTYKFRKETNKRRLLHRDKRPYCAIHLKKRPTEDTFRKETYKFRKETNKRRLLHRDKRPYSDIHLGKRPTEDTTFKKRPINLEKRPTKNTRGYL